MCPSLGADRGFGRDLDRPASGFSSVVNGNLNPANSHTDFMTAVNGRLTDMREPLAIGDMEQT
jgi:hypothetical protein